jgi:putative inorganic carbon (hco3(-)) transporter
VKDLLSTARIEGKIKHPLIDRITGPAGMFVLALIAIGLGVGSAVGGILTGLLILVAMVAIPSVYAVVVYPMFGIVAMLIMAFFLFFIIRLGVNFPLGTAMDGLQLLLIIGFLIKQKRSWNADIYKNQFSVMILVWIGYNLFQLANPWAESRLAWVYTVRTVAVVTLMYFVFIYHLRSVQSIRLVIRVWIILAFCGALYGFKQEYLGIAPSELAELEKDPMAVSLLFINGAWRKYSLFSDPVAFSYTMVCGALICIALISSRISLIKKAVLGVMTCIFMVSMLFSGTRGAYVLLPAALVPFALLNFNKKIMFASGVAAFMLAFLIVVPTGNPTLSRFQSAFRPSEDASFNVRKNNQKRIQPYILSHPFGGGLGSTGIWGQRFAPNSFLATFPPDSGYVRVAVEMGWVGLMIFCILMFTILKMGITNFYRIQNPELKTYCLAVTLVIFALNVGNFPQEALVQYPSNILFYMAAAIIHTTYLIDQKERKQKSNLVLEKKSAG